jgi:hypothetical protein
MEAILGIVAVVLMYVKIMTSTPSRNTEINPIVPSNIKLPLLIALLYMLWIISFQR